tara:strand:+ start:8080 stop:8943 length:864 start_codon:yes stop_codon:yes gene_type:complete
MSYGKTPEEHLPLFQILNTQRAFEEEVYMSGMGGAYDKAEGQAVQYDDIQETYTSRYNMETVALGFKVTKEAIDDDLYDNISRQKSLALGKAMADTKQVKAASIFNNGFNASFIGGDGKALFASDHPTTSGTDFDNSVAVDLSESALEDACIAISKFVDDRGILMSERPDSLHIPPELSFVAHKILQSDLSTGIGIHAQAAKDVNDTNALRDMGKFPGGVFVNHRFTDPDAWFLKTTCQDGTKMFIREALQGSDDTDFNTDNAMFKFRERYAFGWSDPRGWYGSTGA